jgi:spore coat protein U-like protein
MLHKHISHFHFNLISLSLLTLIGSLPMFAWAGTTSASTKASATLASNCQISASNISFGNYNPSSGDSFATGNIALLCTKGASATVGININAANTDIAAINTKYSAYYASNSQYYVRTLSGTKGGVLYYNLFQDAGHTQIFGGSNYFHLNSGAFVYITGNGQTQNIPVYGAMGGAQYVAPDSYVDNISVSVSY